MPPPQKKKNSGAATVNSTQIWREIVRPISHFVGTGLVLPQTKQIYIILKCKQLD